MIDTEYLKKKLPGLKIIYFDEIDSTNSEAKRRILSGEKERCLYIASCQTLGRGRQGKSFYSPKDTGLYLSFSYPVRENEPDAVSITSQSAVAAAAAIESLSGIGCGIKWVNDIYIKGKKVSGILAESLFCGGHFIIVGIGINLSTKTFPPDIANRAGSLDSPGLSPTLLAEKISENMLYFIDNPSDRSYLESYRKHSIVLGKKIEYIKNSVKYEGTAFSLTDEAHLTVLRSDGRVDELNSGEISLRIKEN